MNLYIPNECNTAMLSAIGIIIYWYLIWLLLEIGLIFKKSNRGLGLSNDVEYFLTFFLQTWNLLASDSNFFLLLPLLEYSFISLKQTQDLMPVNYPYCIVDIYHCTKPHYWNFQVNCKILYICTKKNHITVSYRG